MHPEAGRLIDALQLTAHPEGGYYRETYRSPDTVTTARGTSRSALTSILFLLTTESFSAFHRLASDEVWHFYRGDGIAVEIIAPDGELATHRLGPDGPWQTTVAAGAYFASHVVSGGVGFALVGCDVAPGFDFEDFTVATRADLLEVFPQHAGLIVALTRRAANSTP